MFRADDVIELLPGLAGERPVFHFQQALAWAIHVRIPAFVCGWRPGR